jgi:hypothetical protein
MMEKLSIREGVFYHLMAVAMAWARRRSALARQAGEMYDGIATVAGRDYSIDDILLNGESDSNGKRNQYTPGCYGEKSAFQRQKSGIILINTI